MRWMVLAAGFALIGCTEPTIYGGGAPSTPPPEGSPSAIFAERPVNLFAVAGAACNRPGQNVVRPSADEVRCETLPGPESAAGLILEFDGTVEDLPKYIIRFVGTPLTQGYMVTGDAYIRVPLRDGGARQVRLPDPRVDEQLAEIMRRAGGTPL